MDRFLTLCIPLAWPLATLLIALIFRRDLSQALGRVGKVKYHDLELTFRDDLHKAEELARSISSPAPKPPVMLEVAPQGEAKSLEGRLIVPPSTLDDMSEDLAEKRPREAVAAAWSVVDHALARRSKLDRPPVGKYSEISKVVALLRSLRDRAVQADQPPPSPEDARRFVDLARRVALRIEELA